MKVLTYKQWKAERGNPKEVELIEFIDFVRINGSVYKFKEKENTYVGEIWEARDENKLLTKAIIKVEYPEEYVDDNIGWDYKKEYSPECIDYWVNPLVDEYDTVIQRIRNNSFKRDKNVNIGLLREIDKEKEILQKYEDILKNIEKNSREYIAIEKYLNFMNSPTSQTMKDWQRVNKILKNKIRKLWETTVIAPVAAGQE